MPKIPYYLLKNTTGAQESFRPMVVPRGQAFEMIVSKLAAQLGKPDAEVRAFLLAVGPAVGDLVAQGYTIDWPNFVQIKPLIARGTVSGPNDQLPTTKRGDASFSPRGSFKNALDHAEVERVEAPATAPEWQSVTAQNGQLGAITNRTMITVLGKNLDFNDTRPDEGLFVRTPAVGTLLKLIPSTHTSQRIDALMPDGLVSDATYSLELHTRGAHGAASRELAVYVWTGELIAA